MKQSSLFALLAFVLSLLSSSAGEEMRSRTPLVNWLFMEEKAQSDPIVPPGTGEWKPVTVPHVFRQSGLPDDVAGWYRQTLQVSDADRGQRFYLMLEGAASVKDVFVNGQHIGQHKGAFSRCFFDLTPALKFDGANMLDVRVTNREEEARNCFSRSSLYYVNGGMFRPAWLVKTRAVHIFPEMGSTGVYLTPKNITAESADLEAGAMVRNAGREPAAVTVRFFVEDPEGTACGEFSAQQAVPAGAVVRLQSTGKIVKPLLWDFAMPNMYSVRVEVSVDGKVVDELTERTGVRTIVWKDQRFYLNGREVQFRGVNKHAQNEYAWNAVSNDEMRHEWKLMTEMGVNTVRLAHYPHSELEYDIADESGIAVWAENGYAGQVWKDPGNEEKTITPDGERLTREMVRQNWNHPSILFWSAGNETILNVVSHYANVIRSEKDPSRLVTYAANAGPAENCDFVANNTYHGWYKGDYPDFAELPENALISETGCGDWITHHVPYGTVKWAVDKYEPEEYADIFTEFRLQTICRNNTANHPMFLWWTFREFYNLKFKKNRNTKGILTLAGMPKDSYYLFQSFLNPGKRVLHLCGRQYFLRTFAPDNGIKAYSNASELQLTLNGVPQEKIKNGSYRLPDTESKKNGHIPGIVIDNVFFWKTPLQPGKNVIKVKDDRGESQQMVIYQKNNGTPVPADHSALVQDLASSNPQSPACFIDRPVESQSAFYSEVDGTSDNTFDILPQEVQGAGWIATRRLSDPKLKTDLSFRLNPSATASTVFVLFSTGHYPTVTLKENDPAITVAAAALRAILSTAGFQPASTHEVWRDHDLNRANAELWKVTLQPGAKINLPGQTMDYVVMVKGGIAP